MKKKTVLNGTIVCSPDELKPCPFCGGKARIYFHNFYGEYYAECDICHAIIGRFPEYRNYSIDMIIKAWNRKADDKGNAANENLTSGDCYE